MKSVALLLLPAALFTAAFAACGDECEKKGGMCSWKSPGDEYSYDGVCKDGKWGVGDLCYCGYCYVKCETSPKCNGICHCTSEMFHSLHSNSHSSKDLQLPTFRLCTLHHK